MRCRSRRPTTGSTTRLSGRGRTISPPRSRRWSSRCISRSTRRSSSSRAVPTLRTSRCCVRRRIPASCRPCPGSNGRWASSPWCARPSPTKDRATKSSSASRSERELLTIDGREVAVSNPAKVLFPKPGHTKLDLVRYYLAIAEGALRGAGGRPNMLVRFPNGIDGEFFYQKRAPQARPPWIEVVELRFPSGRAADEVVPRSAAALAWMANLACLELHPHPVRAEDREHPD